MTLKIERIEHHLGIGGLERLQTPGHTVWEPLRAPSYIVAAVGGAKTPLAHWMIHKWAGAHNMGAGLEMLLVVGFVLWVEALCVALASWAS